MALPDAFTRADNVDLGTEWDAGYDFCNAARITTNAVRSTVLNAESIESYNALSPGADQWASIKITALAANNCLAGVILRANPPPNPVTFYWVAAGGFTGSNYTVCKKRVAWTETQIYSANTAWVVGDTLRAEISSNTITILRNGGLVTTVVDAAITGAGRVGIYLWVATAGTLADAQLDDFNAGSIVSVGQPTMKRWGGIPQMLGGRLLGRTW